MTPERLAKIRAIANDARGNPHMREVAQAMLKKYGGAEERWKPPPDPPSPGMETSEEYDRFIFMDLENWGQSAKGNYVHTTKYEGRAYKFVLFTYPKTPHLWGWLREDVANDTQSWGRNKYATLREAHESAWLHLTLL